jgi:endoglucanase
MLGLMMLARLHAAGAGTVLWSNRLDDAADFALLDPAAEPVAINGRPSVLRVHKDETEGAVLRRIELPVANLSGRWVYLTADIKAREISAKPEDWNGIKVMMQIETPQETQWPQIALPDGSFDWRQGSVRILVPAETRRAVLHVGLERVSGTAWFDNLRIVLARLAEDAPAAPANQPVFKGHDRPALRGVMAHPRMTQEDLRVLARSWGGNLVRWQLLRVPAPAENGDPDAYDRWLAGELERLDEVLSWAEKWNVKVVVDLHSPPGGPVGEGGTVNAGGAFWTNRAAQDRFVTVWQRIARRYKGQRETIWGFDLLNEPDDRAVTPGHDDWQALAARAARAVREIDPDRTLIVEPPRWGDAGGFAGFRPLDLPRVVYSFHMYAPFEYTHQQLRQPAKPIAYPGWIGDKKWDRSALREAMRPAIDFARRYRVHLYVGEFSAIRWAPGADRYLEDILSIFEEHGWDWSYHAFREWHGWDLEMGTDRNARDRMPPPGKRQQAVRAWMRRNHPYAERAFPADAVIDITRPPYGARPDEEEHDDTEAIQRAVTDHVGTGRVLYFPPGIYRLQRPIAARNPAGRWDARITLQGACRDTTILRLADRAEGFSDPERPLALYATGSIQQEGDCPEGGGNKAYGNYVLDLTIDTGAGNPGAVGIAWANSNFGAIRDVAIRSGDGSGVAGIAMTRRIPGPGLIQHVSIDGFAVGLDVADIQYGVTVDALTLRGQTLAGIRNDRNVLHVNRLQSEQSVPAILGTDTRGVLTLLNSTLRSVNGTAAIVSRGSVWLENVRAPEGILTVRSRQRVWTGCRIDRYGDPEPLGEPAAGPARWPDAVPAPEVRERDLAKWVAVGPRRPGEADDTEAIQRAMDAGGRVVYFPNDRTYFVRDTIMVRGAVRLVQGLGAEISLGAAEEPFRDSANPRPLFRLDPAGEDPVALEHLFFNAQYPGVVIFENNTPASVVIRHCGGWIGTKGIRRSYRPGAEATGPLFLEDLFLPGWRFEGQSVWARQFNPENPDGNGVEPQVLNAGGSLWILGFKTEGPAPYLVTTKGGVTSVHGAYNYVSAIAAPRLPEHAVPYVADRAAMALSFVTDNFRNQDYAVYLRVIRDDGKREWTAADLPGRNGRPDDKHSRVVSRFFAP